MDIKSKEKAPNNVPENALEAFMRSYVAKADASSYQFPETQNYKNASYSTFLSPESKSMVRAMIDSLVTENMFSGVNISYDESVPARGREMLGKFDPFGTIHINQNQDLDGTHFNQTSSVSHEMIHYAMIGGLSDAQIRELDNLAVQRDSLLKYMGAIGSSEPSAYSINDSTMANMENNPVWRRLKQMMQEKYR